MDGNMRFVFLRFPFVTTLNLHDSHPFPFPLHCPRIHNLFFSNYCYMRIKPTESMLCWLFLGLST